MSKFLFQTSRLFYWNYQACCSIGLIKSLTACSEAIEHLIRNFVYGNSQNDWYGYKSGGWATFPRKNFSKILVFSRKIYVENVQTAPECVWCGGRDLNPRHPDVRVPYWELQFCPFECAQTSGTLPAELPPHHLCFILTRLKLICVGRTGR